MNRPVPNLLPWSTIALALLAGGCGGTGNSADLSLYQVVRRDLQITIKENAELQAQRETVVRSEVEGQATIIYLIEEGRTVEQGELLVKIDASELIDKRANQAITVAKAEAGLTQARKALEILQKELKTNLNTAEGNLRIAEMELEKFLGRSPEAGRASLGSNTTMIGKLRELVEPEPGPADGGPVPASLGNGEPAVDAAPTLVAQIDPRRYGSLVLKVTALLADVDGGRGALERDMGDMANQVLQQVDKIRLAMADLKYQEAYYGHSLQLAKKKFLTPNELEKDQIEYQRRLSQVALAWNALDLLISYELQKNKIKLLQDVENARLERERVIASNDSEQTRADSELRSAQAEYDLAKDRLDNLERQIAHADIRAPTPGLVIYSRLERDRRTSDAIREGIQVRERQDLIILPDTTRMQAVVKVQEAVVAQVRTGMQAHIGIEAYPDRVFTGHVVRVAQQADSSSGWMTSDRKVYTTIVELDGENTDSTLRSRMAAAVTILVDELKGVLAVPMQAVKRDRAVNYVWRRTAAGPQPVVVAVGRNNTEHVVIDQGVAEGDMIYLATPPGAQPPNLLQPAVPMPVLEPAPAPAAGAPTNGSEHEPGTGRNRPGNGDGAGGPGGNRLRGGMFGSKPLAEMSTEELAQFKQGLGMMRGMAERARASGDEERAQRTENALSELELALEQGNLEQAQQVLDRMRSTMRSQRGGQGNGGERGGGRTPAPGEGGDGGQGRRTGQNGG